MPAAVEASSPAAEAERWWEQEPLTILDLHTFAGEITRFPAPELAQMKATLGFNTDAFYVHNLFDGMDDEGFFFRTPLATVQHPDYLKDFMPEAHKRGMRATIYFNVHYFTMEFAKKHPDWVQVVEGGGIMDKMYGHGTTFCVNSPWSDWVAELMNDLCKYPMDGIFVDGPAFFPETCFCHWCHDKFRKLYGHELPSKRERKGKGAAELLEFQGNSLADFMRDISQVIKSNNPNILLYGNHTALTGNWATGQVNRRLIKEQDLLASEGGYVYNDLNQTPLWKAGLRARMIETQAGGKPTVIIACPALKPWTHAMLPAAEARLMYADIIANGASPMDEPHADRIRPAGTAGHDRDESFHQGELAVPARDAVGGEGGGGVVLCDSQCLLPRRAVDRHRRVKRKGGRRQSSARVLGRRGSADARPCAV